MNDFLPKDYRVPETSGYTKLKEGANTFRVLSPAITGYEYWNVSNKPVRSKELPKTTPEDIRLEEDGRPTRIKHFWAFIVWNYATKSLQIYEITQVTIQKQVKALIDNKQWGDPGGYDLTITKKGEGFQTEYIVMPNPHSKVTSEVLDSYKNTSIKLEALYDGANPFEVKGASGKDEINPDEIPF